MKKNMKYILLFFVYLLSITYFYISFRMDTYAHYGFSYGIVNGQIPYKEINFIVPAFSPFFYSIFLLLNKSILSFYIGQSILLVIFSYLLFQIMEKKAWIIIAALFCPYIFGFAYCLFPGYNFLVLFELVLLLYLHDKNKSDKVIGFLAGIVFLTKHNIGIFILIITILYPFFKNYKKSITRLLFSMIPIVIFFIYLLLNNNLYDFIDLCFLNVSEFSNNFVFQILYFVLLVIFLLLVLVQYIVNKNKNISYYYLLCYLPIAYPLVEMYHVSLFLYFALIVLIYNIDFKVTKYISIISFMIIFIFISSYYYFSKAYFKNIKIYSYHNFPITLATAKEKKDYDEIIKFVKNKNAIYISDASFVAFLTSTTESNINKYLVLYRGNYGHNGEKRLIEDIKKEKNVYFVVANYLKCDEECQFIEKVPELIKRNYKIVKKLNYYTIYYKK